MCRIRVASDSAGTLSSSSLLLEFIWSVSEIQQPIEKFSKVALERNWTRDHLFTGVSPPKSCYSQWKHRCFFFSVILKISFQYLLIFETWIELYFLKVQKMMKSLYLAADVSWKPTPLYYLYHLTDFSPLKIPLAKCTGHILNDGMWNCTIRYLKWDIFLLPIVNLLYKSFLDLNFTMNSSTFILLDVVIINYKLIQTFKFIKYNCVYLNILIRFVNRKFIYIFSVILSEDSSIRKFKAHIWLQFLFVVFYAKNRYISLSLMNWLQR